VEQLYFADVEVGPTLHKLLMSARRRFMRFEFTSGRSGRRQFLPGDDWGCAHMPEMAVNWVISKQTHKTIRTALTELYDVNFSNFDIFDKQHIHINIEAKNVRDGLKHYLSKCLAYIIIYDEEVYLLAKQRFAMINAGSLDNYGCRGKKIRKIQKLKILSVDGEGECCAGRGLNPSSHPCDHPTSYKIVINSRKTIYSCEFCFRWVFSDQSDTLGLWQ
jgi:hypothetical protein